MAGLDFTQMARWVWQSLQMISSNLYLAKFAPKTISVLVLALAHPVVGDSWVGLQPDRCPDWSRHSCKWPLKLLPATSILKTMLQSQPLALSLFELTLWLGMAGLDFTQMCQSLFMFHATITVFVQEYTGMCRALSSLSGQKPKRLPLALKGQN